MIKVTMIINTMCTTKSLSENTGQRNFARFLNATFQYGFINTYIAL